MKMNNPMQHMRNVKDLQNIIASYENKLDDKVNEVYEHIINHSNHINDHENSLPKIQNKKITQSRGISSQFNLSSIRNRKGRAQSIGPHSLINTNALINDMSYSQDVSPADELLRSYKNRLTHHTRPRNQDTLKSLDIETAPQRAIGGQKYGKPKLIRKKPQILSKQMRWDPFYEKNAIKAQELDKGMMSLIQRGKVSKNIDIITAFQKGRPVLNTNQAIFHHIEQKYAQSDLQQQISRITKKKKDDSIAKNPQKQERQFKKLPQTLINIQQATKRENIYEQNNNWALTLPEQSNMNNLGNTQRMGTKKIFDDQEILQNFSLEFLHYKIVMDDNFMNMKKTPNFNQNWGQVKQIIKQIEKTLKQYTVELCFISSVRILELVRSHYSLRRLKLIQIANSITCQQKNQKDNKSFSLKSVKNIEKKKQMSLKILQPFFIMSNIRKKYMDILRRKRVEKRMANWMRNGSLIKQYRQELSKHKQENLHKFDILQKKFRLQYPSIQSTKHFQIHCANYNFMKDFKYFSQFCTTEITRIFNLQNSNTNIIYLCPFEVNVDTINYYFKIMQLEEIEMYNDRVTFLELQDLKSEVTLPSFLSTSAKMYYNSKALRKLKRKILGNPAYFVTNYPSQTDINLSVYLDVPILCGNFHKINPIRSAMDSNRFNTESLPPMQALRIQPKQSNVFEISNLLIRYCESHKKYRKYVIKINNKSSSSGLALLQYPFSSLPEMYGCTSLVQPYFYSSIQKFYTDLARYGGVVEFYMEGIKCVTVCAKIVHDGSYIITGTFEKVSNGFVNIGYLFPQKVVNHRVLAQKCRPLLDKLIDQGHIGFVELTVIIDVEENIFLEEIQLFSTKITNSLSYFKFLQGGYFNNMGQFMTKITADDDPEEMLDDSIATMEPRGYCYIPFMLHFGLSEKQTTSFFQLCRIAGISFDLENKYGTTFVLLGSLKNTIGILTTAKERKSIIKLVSKSTQFLIKQNSHNVSAEMLKEKQERLKERYNIVGIKQRFEDLLQ